MDGSRFDHLTKSLVQDTSRRRVLKGLVGAVAGTLIGGHFQEIKAACPAGQYAGSNSRCLCRATGRPPGPGGCSCPTGWTQCPNGCQPAGSPTGPLRCGPCAELCPVPADECLVAICSDGTCGTAPASAGTPCQSGDSECNGSGQCVQTCLPLQTRCVGNEDACCQAEAPTVCSYSDALGTVCCRVPGQPCAHDLDCCGRYVPGSEICRDGFCL